MPGDVLDVIVIVLAALFAAAGYREGFIVGVLGCAGFLAGAGAGVVVAAGLIRLVVRGAYPQTVTALIVVFVMAVAGQLLGSLIGVAIRRRLQWRPARLAEALGGAAVSMVSVLFIAGFLGAAVAHAPPSAMTRQVASSTVLKGVDTLVPPAVFAQLRGLLSNSPYAPLFGPLGQDGRLPALAVPDERVLGSPALGTDAPGIVKITGETPDCARPVVQGTGFVFAPHHILTNAHVVAGVTSGPWISTDQASPVLARVVLFDPRRDIAVLYAPTLNTPALRFARNAPAGADAIVAGYPRGQPFTAVPARLGSHMAARVPDIYLTTVNRDIYWLRAMVKPGNSGGPLLAPNGTVYGMVFADAPDQHGYAVALTTGEIMPDARAGANATTPVSTQHCTP